MHLRQYVSYAALASLSALTGVVLVFATSGLLTASGNSNRGSGSSGGSNNYCNAERCCFLCDTTSQTPGCMAIEWEESYGDYYEYCSSVSAGEIYFETKGDCESSGQCQNNSNCYDGIDNDGDQWFDDYDPDCINGAPGGESNFDGSADLDVKIDGSDSLGQGDIVTYTVTIENFGEGVANNVDIYGTLASALTYIGNEEMPCNIANNSFNCRLNLDSSRTEKLDFEVRVDGISSVIGSCNYPIPAIEVSAYTESMEFYQDNNAATMMAFLDCGECQSGLDNNGDGLIDEADLDCNEPFDHQNNGPGDNNGGIIPEPQQPPPPPMFVPELQQPPPPPVFVPEPQQPDIPVPIQAIESRERERIDNLQQHLQVQQLRNAVNIQNNNPASNNASTTLGCFTAGGVWTSDRSLCDQDQNRHIAQRAPGTIQETNEAAVIHQQIQQRFVGDQNLSELMDTLHALREKLLFTQEHQSFSERDNQFVDYSIGWLNGQIVFYSTLEFSPEHVDYSVAIMNDIVKEMEKITQNVQQEEIEIEDIVSGIGGLIGKTYSAIQVLFRENVYVPDEIISEFQRANSLFIEIQNHCNGNQDTCGELSDVIAILEPMLDSLKNVVESSGSQSIEDEIFQIFGN